MDLCKKNLLIIVICLLPFHAIFADCIIDNSKEPAGSLQSTALKTITFGQSFLACQTGLLNSLTINTSGGDIELFLMEGSGANIDLNKPYQKFSATPAGKVTLAISPFQVVDKRLYSFAIGGVNEILFDWTPNNMSDDQDSFRFEGVVFFAQPISDLFYALNFQSNPIVPIPTFSEWGLFLFMLIIINISVYYLQKIKVLHSETTS